MHKARNYSPAVHINAKVYIVSQGDISIEHLAFQWLSVELEQWTLISTHPTPYGYISTIPTLRLPPRCFWKEANCLYASFGHYLRISLIEALEVN